MESLEKMCLSPKKPLASVWELILSKACILVMFGRFTFKFFLTGAAKRYLIPEPGHCNISSFFLSYVLTKTLCNKVFTLLFQSQVIQFWFNLGLCLRAHIDVFIRSLENIRYSDKLQMHFQKTVEPTSVAACSLSEELIPFLSLSLSCLCSPASYLVLTVILVFRDPLVGQLNLFSQEKHSCFFSWTWCNEILDGFNQKIKLHLQLYERICIHAGTVRLWSNKMP